MAIKRTFTYQCDECGHQVVYKDQDREEDWHELYRSWYTADGGFASEEFNLCSDACAAAFDPREHREYT